MAVRLAGGREAGDDHVRLESADHPDHVAQHGLAAPDGQALLGRLGVAEIPRPREELLGPVNAAGCQQLLGADSGQERSLLGADEVLAAAAAGQRQVRRADLPAARHVRQQGGVLVVGVGRHVQDAAQHREPVQRELQGGGVPRGRRRNGGDVEHAHRGDDENDQGTRHSGTGAASRAGAERHVNSLGKVVAIDGAGAIMGGHLRIVRRRWLFVR